MMRKFLAHERPMALVARNLLVFSAVWCCQTFAQVPDNQLMFELLNRIEQLEQEIRQLRGDMEMYRYRQEGFKRRLAELEKQAGVSVTTPGSRPSTPSRPYPSAPGAQQAPPYNPQSNQFRESVRPGFGRVTPEPYQQSPSLVNQPPASEKKQGFASPTQTEQVAYDTAIDRLREGNYQQAIGGFQEFLKRHPRSTLAGDAQYWLGEAYYVNRDFAKSRQAFIAMGTNYPNSSRLPDAMLKLGYVYEALGEKSKARQVLQKLVQTYPKTQAASLAESRLQSLR